MAEKKASNVDTLKKIIELIEGLGNGIDKQNQDGDAKEIEVRVIIGEYDDGTKIEEEVAVASEFLVTKTEDGKFRPWRRLHNADGTHSTQAGKPLEFNEALVSIAAMMKNHGERMGDIFSADTPLGAMLKLLEQIKKATA